MPSSRASQQTNRGIQETVQDESGIQPSSAADCAITLAKTMGRGFLSAGSVIPEPDDQKAHRKCRGSRGGRPVTYDRNAYHGRNVIERAFNGFKHWRGLATRYDKHATVYRGALVLAAALLWINDLSGVAGVLGAVRAFGELRQRSCGAATNSMRRAAHSTTFEPALLKGVKHLSFRGRNP